FYGTDAWFYSQRAFSLKERLDDLWFVINRRFGGNIQDCLVYEGAVGKVWAESGEAIIGNPCPVGLRAPRKTWGMVGSLFNQLPVDIRTQGLLITARGFFRNLFITSSADLEVSLEQAQNDTVPSRLNPVITFLTAIFRWPPGQLAETTESPRLLTVGEISEPETESQISELALIITDNYNQILEQMDIEEKELINQNYPLNDVSGLIETVLPDITLFYNQQAGSGTSQEEIKALLTDQIEQMLAQLRAPPEQLEDVDFPISLVFAQLLTDSILLHFQTQESTQSENILQKATQAVTSLVDTPSRFLHLAPAAGEVPTRKVSDIADISVRPELSPGFKYRDEPLLAMEENNQYYPDEYKLNEEDIKYLNEDFAYMQEMYGFLSEDTPVVANLQTYLDRIHELRPDEPHYRLVVLANDKRVNAFSSPDGTLFVTMGMISVLSGTTSDRADIGEMVYLMVHEKDHAWKNHQKILDKYREGRDSISELSLRWLYEVESDLSELKIMMDLGFDPRVLADRTLARLEDASGKNNFDPIHGSYTQRRERLQLLFHMRDYEMYANGITFSYQSVPDNWTPQFVNPDVLAVLTNSEYSNKWVSLLNSIQSKQILEKIMTSILLHIPKDEPQVTMIYKNNKRMVEMIKKADALAGKFLSDISAGLVSSGMSSDDLTVASLLLYHQMEANSSHSYKAKSFLSPIGIIYAYNLRHPEENIFSSYPNLQQVQKLLDLSVTRPGLVNLKSLIVDPRSCTVIDVKCRTEDKNFMNKVPLNLIFIFRRSYQSIDNWLGVDSEDPNYFLKLFNKALEMGEIFGGKKENQEEITKSVFYTISAARFDQGLYPNMYGDNTEDDIEVFSKFNEFVKVLINKYQYMQPTGEDVKNYFMDGVKFGGDLEQKALREKIKLYQGLVEKYVQSLAPVWNEFSVIVKNRDASGLIAYAENAPPKIESLDRQMRKMVFYKDKRFSEEDLEWIASTLIDNGILVEWDIDRGYERSLQDKETIEALSAFDTSKSTLEDVLMVQFTKQLLALEFICKGLSYEKSVQVLERFLTQNEENIKKLKNTESWYQIAKLITSFVSSRADVYDEGWRIEGYELGSKKSMSQAERNILADRLLKHSFFTNFQEKLIIESKKGYYQYRASIYILSDIFSYLYDKDFRKAKGALLIGYTRVLGEFVEPFVEILSDRLENLISDSLASSDTFKSAFDYSSFVSDDRDRFILQKAIVSQALKDLPVNEAVGFIKYVYETNEFTDVELLVNYVEEKVTKKEDLELVLDTIGDSYEQLRKVGSKKLSYLLIADTVFQFIREPKDKLEFLKLAASGGENDRELRRFLLPYWKDYVSKTGSKTHGYDLVLQSNGSYSIEGPGAGFFVPFDDFMDSLYRMKNWQKTILLNKLLVDNGVLSFDVTRAEFAKWLGKSVDSRRNFTLARFLKIAISSMIKVSDPVDIALPLIEMINPQTFIPVHTPTDRLKNNISENIIEKWQKFKRKYLKKRNHFEAIFDIDLTSMAKSINFHDMIN
ncbi:hypothetical protein ACFL1A_03440, partial [Patescibacteria group bacterium]